LENAKLTKNIQTIRIVLLLILPLAIAPHAMPEKLFSFSGYYKNFSTLLMQPAYKLQDTTVEDPDLGALISRVRFKLDSHPLNFLSFHFAYDLSPRIQDPSLFDENALFILMRPAEYRFDDFRDRLYPGPGEPVSSFGLFHNLDRFYMTLETDFADIYLGRQPIAWGSARVINPTDVIAPFAFNELDKEESWGVDAIRMRIPLGMMDELDVGYVAGEDFHVDNSAFFIRGKIYKFQTDVSAIFLGFRKHLLIGLDIARAIGGAGFWLEAAYVVPDFFREKENLNDENYFRASIGLDYNLNSKTYGFIEYHFNSAGENQPEKYTNLVSSSAYQDGAVYLLGQHYLNIGSTYQLSPLMPITGLLIVNLNDWSLVLSPFLEYNIAENIYLAAGAYLGLGKNPEWVLGPLLPRPLLLRSEFGSYPDMLFTSFRIYF
jgi:hypothetical protein